MPQPATFPTPQERFLSLLKRDILKLELAALDFGIYRILNYRRTQVLDYLGVVLPGRIATWTHSLAASSGKELAETESANCYYHLHTFFSRYWDDGDFIPRARRGGTAAYAVPYNGQDTHFHWATKGSHYVKSGELFARYAYKDGTQEVRFVLTEADIAKDNAKGAQKYFFPAGLQQTEAGCELQWQWRSATDAENKRYKSKTAANTKADDLDMATGSQADDSATATTGDSLQERVLNAWLAGDDFKSAKPPKTLDPVLLAGNARRFVRKNTSDFFVHPQLGAFLRGELDVYLKHEFVQVWDAPDAELPRIRAKFKLVRDIAGDLITFLDQIEQFQATLFEKRKFLLVEQGEYFDTVTLPRIAKVMTAPDWKNGVPKSDLVHDNGGDPGHWSRRTLPLVRVLRLERYQDSLNALDLSHSVAQADAAQASLPLIAGDAQEQLLRYWLMDDSAGTPVRLSTQSLADPFAYKLTLQEPTGAREVAVDMLETARLLLRLVPKRQFETQNADGLRHQRMEAQLAADLAHGVAAPRSVLLWLRPVADDRTPAQAKAEHQWLADTVSTRFQRTLNDYDTVFHNRSAFWPANGTGGRGSCIDSLLTERMMERAPL